MKFLNIICTDFSLKVQVTCKKIVVTYAALFWLLYRSSTNKTVILLYSLIILLDLIYPKILTQLHTIGSVLVYGINLFVMI